MNTSAVELKPVTSGASREAHPLPAADGLPRLAVSGRWIKIAQVHDEIWLEGEAVPDPGGLFARLKQENFKADIFCFGQKFPETKPKHAFYFEWDNFAAIPLTTHANWWNDLSQESRRNVRLAGKRGAVIREAAFDDELVRGIAGIYNETPIRQGRKFPHYGKDIATVKRENGTYAERSQFIGAYAGEELIGFAKMVYVDNVASLMQILSKNAHLDKKPMNALLAKAVELAAAHGSQYLVYRKYTYGNVFSALTEFKRRNGFVEMKYPRYYIPLTWRGRMAMRFRLHLGLREALPPGLVSRLTRIRSKFVEWSGSKKSAVAPSP